jgi:hypothetical protein
VRPGELLAPQPWQLARLSFKLRLQGLLRGESGRQRHSQWPQGLRQQV